MKKLMTKLVNFIFGVIVLVLITYILGTRFFPDQIKKYVGYQTYVILTDSMEPTIPVGSLVISKNIEDPKDITENTIISFRVDRFGDDTVFTHYFKKRELDETGRIRYFTIAENANRYDDYVTYEENILGTYVVHVPYIGKFVMFLQSPFALIELGIILFILLLNRILWDKFDREEKELLAVDENEENIVDAENICELEPVTNLEMGADKVTVEESLSVEDRKEILKEAENTIELGEESLKVQMVPEPKTVLSDTKSVVLDRESEVLTYVDDELENQEINAIDIEAENDIAIATSTKIEDGKPTKKEKDKKTDKKLYKEKQEKDKQKKGKKKKKKHNKKSKKK